MIKIHFHADCDGITSAFFVSRELDRLGKEYAFFPSLGSSVDLRGNGNISLDISSASGSGTNLSIDHHVSDRPEFFYANARNAGFEWPVSFTTYALFGDADKAWISAIGVVADWGAEKVPRTFWDVVRSQWPSLAPEVDQKKLVRSKLGDMALMIDSLVALERSDGALKALKALKEAESWEDFISGKGLASELREAKATIDSKVSEVFGNEFINEDLVILRYASPHRIKSLVAAMAKDRYPNRLIVVAQDEDDTVRISLRHGERLNELIKKLTKDIGNGGGHPKASGGWVQTKNWPLFKKRLLAANPDDY